MLIEELQRKLPAKNKIFSFYNMVQANKNLHKFYLNIRNDSTSHILNSYIPFYSEIETISLNKMSIFHQLKEFKTNIYYENLWLEICDRMQWQSLLISKTHVVDIKEDHEQNSPSIVHFSKPGQVTKAANG